MTQHGTIPAHSVLMNLFPNMSQNEMILFFQGKKKRRKTIEALQSILYPLLAQHYTQFKRQAAHLLGSEATSAC